MTAQLALTLPRPPAKPIPTDLGWHTPDLSAFRFHLTTTERGIVKKNHIGPETEGARETQSLLFAAG